MFVLKDGEIFTSGTPAEVFSRADELNEMGLEPPFSARLASLLKRRGFRLPEGIYTKEALADALAALGRSDG